MTWMLILSMTTDFSAHGPDVRENFDRPTRACAGVWDQRRWQARQV